MSIWDHPICKTTPNIFLSREKNIKLVNYRIKKFYNYCFQFSHRNFYLILFTITITFTNWYELPSKRGCQRFEVAAMKELKQNCKIFGHFLIIGKQKYQRILHDWLEIKIRELVCFILLIYSIVDLNFIFLCTYHKISF